MNEKELPKNFDRLENEDVEDLREQFEFYKYHLPGAMIEVTLDVDSPQITFMNRIAQILFGYDESDIEDGLIFWEMVASDEEAERILQLSFDYFGNSVMKGEPYQRSAEQELFEINMKRKDGSFFYAEVQASVIMNEDKIPYKLVAVFRDISRRKLLEKDHKNLIQELQGAIDDLKSFQGLMEICESCHRIKTKDGTWMDMETFLNEKSQIELKDVKCPDCENS